jgi:hypothetical protein
VLASLLIACGGTPAPGPAAPSDDAPHAELAGDDGFRPSYSKHDLERALIAERGKEASAQRVVGELAATLAAAEHPDPAVGDRWRTAVADLAVRERFIAGLELCQASDRGCPPRLDEPAWTWDRDADQGSGKPPPLDATLRFDLADWRAIAVELRGRACACRTVDCLDDLDVAIAQLETRPTPEVGDDDAAAAAIVGARECLFRLRGKAVAKITVPPAVTDEP